MPLSLLAGLVLASALLTQGQDELLRRSDIGMFAPPSFRARLTLTDPKSKVHEIEIWRAGQTKTLIRFLDARDHGKYLIRLGDELWLLTPGAKRPVRLGSSYRLYGGATLDEVLGLKLAENFDVVSATSEKAGGSEMVVFELRAKPGKMLFASVRYTVSRDASRPVNAVYRLRSGREATSVDFLEWGEERGAVYARKVAVRDLLRKGARTVVTVTELDARAVPPALFDLNDPSARRALEAGR